MAQNRLDRDLESREKSERKRSWQRPELLPEPKPVDGFVYRWIRLSTLGRADAPNISSKLREGWEPVRAEDHPEIMMVNVEDDRYKDNIVIGGLMLCRAPIELAQERTEFYEEQNAAQMNSVDNNFLRENDSRMPLFADRKSSVTFGKGK